MRPQDLFPQYQNWGEIQIADHPEASRPGWIEKAERQARTKIFGGYLENRSPLFDARHVPEYTIHLGQDIWVTEGTPVTFPLDGTVLAAAPQRSKSGGWGGRLDILADGLVWILGHLAAPTIAAGEKISPGDIVGQIGSREENGGWVPHLHIQCATPETYYSFPNPRDMDAYAAPSETLGRDYPNPFAKGKAWWEKVKATSEGTHTYFRESEILRHMPKETHVLWNSFLRGQGCLALENDECGIFPTDFHRFIRVVKNL